MANRQRDVVLSLSGKRTAFTLVELLVVVSIISVMMSILLPSLTNAQKQGESVHCLANQRQLAMAWMTYAQDFEQLLCTPERFTTQLRPYVANVDGVFLCKGLKMDRGVASYGISNTMGGQPRDDVKPFAALQHVTHSSRMLVFTDINPKAKRCFWPLADGSPAGVWTHVYSHIPEPNESDLFIGFLEMPAVQTANRGQVDSEAAPEDSWTRNRMIKRPEDETWVPAGGHQGQEILSSLTRPNAKGQTPIYHKVR